jgi:hypothetical protein
MVPVALYDFRNTLTAKAQRRKDNAIQLTLNKILFSLRLCAFAVKIIF